MSETYEGPFELTDLPNGQWSVSWPGYETVVIDNVEKAEALLKILFDTIKVDEAMVGVVEKHKHNYSDCETMHIGLAAWCQDPRALAQHLVYFTIPGVKFNKLEQAEQFKDLLLKRYVWRKLSQKKWQ